MCKYKTVHSEGINEIIINKSKFIGHAAPIKNEEEGLKFIEKIKSKYYDATHNVYAYVVGYSSNIQRYSDDKEPSGTAGIPILNVIKQENLRNVVIVVTRYFGGKKLGAGGLVRAYSKSAKLSLESAIIIDKVMFKEIMIDIDYQLLGKLENELSKNNFFIKNKKYEQKISLTIICENERIEKLKSILINITNGKEKIIEGNKIYMPVKEGKILD